MDYVETLKNDLLATGDLFQRLNRDFAGRGLAIGKEAKPEMIQAMLGDHGGPALDSMIWTLRMELAKLDKSIEMFGETIDLRARLLHSD